MPGTFAEEHWYPVVDLAVIMSRNPLLQTRKDAPPLLPLQPRRHRQPNYGRLYSITSLTTVRATVTASPILDERYEVNCIDKLTFL